MKSANKVNAFVQHFNVFEYNLGHRRVNSRRREKVDSNLMRLGSVSCVVAMINEMC